MLVANAYGELPLEVVAAVFALLIVSMLIAGWAQRQADRKRGFDR